jgi:hypothetical protein
VADRVFRRWILPAGLILLAGAAGAVAVVSRHAAERPGPAGTTPPAPPPSPPPEKETPLAVVFGGELGGRFWIPPCSKFQLGSV